MFSKFNSNKVTSPTTQDVLIVDFNNRQSKPICHAIVPHLVNCAKTIRVGVRVKTIRPAKLLLIRFVKN